MAATKAIGDVLKDLMKDLKKKKRQEKTSELKDLVLENLPKNYKKSIGICRNQQGTLVIEVNQAAVLSQLSLFHSQSLLQSLQKVSPVPLTDIKFVASQK